MHTAWHGMGSNASYGLGGFSRAPVKQQHVRRNEGMMTTTSFPLFCFSYFVFSSSLGVVLDIGLNDRMALGVRGVSWCFYVLGQRAQWYHSRGGVHNGVLFLFSAGCSWLVVFSLLCFFLSKRPASMEQLFRASD